MLNYLIFRTDRIGDFLISAILIKSIKLNNPQAKITLITSEKNYNYANTFDYIDEKILLKNNFIEKLKIINRLKKKKFEAIIIHDGKKRSSFISFFLKSKKKIHTKSKKTKSQIESIKEILNTLNFKFFSDSLNTINQSKLSTKKNSYIQLHFDEKWIYNDYIKNYINIEPTKDELLVFVKNLIKKSNKKIIITTGLSPPRILNKIVNSYVNKNLEYKISLNFYKLQKIVRDAEILISCHGAISHVAAAFKTRQIDIIDKSYDYNKWTEHFRNYSCVYRDKFNNLSSLIVNKL